MFKQPGANVIETVDKIKTAMPRLADVIPSGVKVDMIVDRTVTIRASVFDVEFTLCADHRAGGAGDPAVPAECARDAHPGAAVPMWLLGAIAVMYAVGFSLDNLSLMALTIAVGFVAVDDAIVVVENIYRYVEKGGKPSKRR